MSRDTARARDAFGVGVLVNPSDVATWYVEWDIDRWDGDASAWALRRLGRQSTAADFEQLRVRPYESSHVEKNLLTTAGLTRITSLITAGGGQALTNTSGRIGVGNGAGTAAVGDTDLSASAGSANRWFQIFDATYPTTAAGVITCRSTFGTADGNFAWQEFSIDIGTPTVTSANTVNATLLNHKTSIAQGTKASGQTWTATSTISIS